jgi:drug/metabolite transporter (DMT)-like permease
VDTWVIFALAAQLVWAAGIYIDKYLVTNEDVDTDVESHNTGMLLLVSAGFGIITSIATAVAMHVFDDIPLRDALLGIGVSSILNGVMVGICQILWLWPYFLALHYGDEITVPPVFQSIPVFGICIGYFWFGETVTLTQLSAMSLVIGGAFWLNMEFTKEKLGEGVKKAFNWRSITFILLASLIISLMSFLFKDVALERSYGAAIFWTGIGMLISGTCIWILMPRYRREFLIFIRKGSRKVKLLNLANEILDNIAMLLFAYAVINAPSTAIAQATQGVLPIFLLIVGWVVASYGSTRHKKQLRGIELVRRISGILIIMIGSLLLFT